LLDGGLLQPGGGTKYCGGFHADYAAALTTGKNTLYLLFCFGCHETKIIRESLPFTADLNAVDFRLTTDFNGKSFDELRALLAICRKERPERAVTPSGS